jgi:hypothetical protein
LLCDTKDLSEAIMSRSWLLSLFCAAGAVANLGAQHCMFSCCCFPGPTNRPRKISTVTHPVVELSAINSKRISTSVKRHSASAGIANRPAPAPPANQTNHRSIRSGLLFQLEQEDRYGVWYSTQAADKVLAALLATLKRNPTLPAIMEPISPEELFRRAVVYSGGGKTRLLFCPAGFGTQTRVAPQLSNQQFDS